MDDGDKPLSEYPLGLDIDSEDSSPSQSEEEEEDEDESVRPRQRRRTGENSEAAIVKRENRRRILEYYQGSYSAIPSALLVWDMCSQLSKETNDMLWFAIVGFTEQFIHEQIPYNKYTTLVNYLGEEVSRFNVDPESAASADSHGERLGRDDLVLSKTHGHVAASSELRFMLLRHWTLYDSMFHSQYVVSRLGIWNEQGSLKLNTLITNMGIPMQEGKNPYNFMSEVCKRHLNDRIVREAEKFQLNHLFYPSFVRQYETNLQLSAADAAFALTALLEECAAGEEDAEDEAARSQRNFWEAYDALASGSKLKRGLQESIKLAKAVVAEGVSVIRGKKYTGSGNFRYLTISESKHLSLLNQPIAASKLALFLVDALMASGSNKKTKPFVICLLKKDTYIVVGVTGKGSRPQAGRALNTFGMAFRTAADKIQARVKHTGFETSILEVQNEDLPKFMQTLHSGLIDL
jgi:cell division control protein 45